MVRSIKERLHKGIIAVIRIKDYNLAKLISETLINKGFHGIELTMSIDGAPKLIKEMKSMYPDKIIGAGTVLKESECVEVIENGADFVVSPCLVDDIAEICNKYKVLCILGIATPTEALKAYNLGCSIVKAFPGDVLQPRFIKDIKSPMPYIEIMPSGGVNLENIGEWFYNGAYSVSVGSALYSGINDSNIYELEERADRYLMEVSKFCDSVY